MSDEPPSPELNVGAGWRELELDVDRLVGRATAAAWRYLPKPIQRANVEVSVTLTDDATIAGLNAQWRGKAGPTDVLSFPATEPGVAWPSSGPLLLGDVVIALESAANDAAALDRPLADHLTHLVVHGLLHLVHHDHQTADQAQAMEALEARILTDLGLADPYLGRPLLEETH